MLLINVSSTPDPLRYQLILTGGGTVPLVTLQVTVRSYPSTMYAGDPIIVIMSVAGITLILGVAHTVPWTWSCTNMHVDRSQLPYYMQINIHYTIRHVNFTVLQLMADP